MHQGVVTLITLVEPSMAEVKIFIEKYCIDPLIVHNVGP